jgi:hypothetical protein
MKIASIAVLALLLVSPSNVLAESNSAQNASTLSAEELIDFARKGVRSIVRNDVRSLASDASAIDNNGCSKIGHKMAV